MIELNTPLEIVEKAATLIENERKMQKLQQKELASMADVPLPTYKKFIHHQKISFETLLKIFIALKMYDNIYGLLKQRDIRTLNEIKNDVKLPSRVVK